MRFRIPLCLMNRHEPNRDASWWDGKNFVSHCLDCGERIRRKNRKRWHKDWLES